MRFFSWCRAAILVSMGSMLASAGCADSKTPPLPPTVVVVATPLERKVTDFEYFTGRLEAVASVDVRARVTGYLQTINFKPGETVKEGDLLFLIDPRPYQADLEKAEGQVALYQAKLERAHRDYERNRPLALKGAIGQQEFDKYVGDKDEAAGGLKAAQAALAGYKLNVDFCKVTAPITGVVSRNNIDIGNLVTQDQTVLTNIVSVDPIFAYFDVDERTVLRVQQLIREGKMKSAREKGTVLNVDIGLSNDDAFPYQATVDFFDNRFNPQTGTIRMRAVLSNPKIRDTIPTFTPGLFVRVRVPIGPPHQSMLVTERALGTDQGQKYVLIVDDKNVVQARPVQVGSLQQGLRVIDSGIQASDRVIINGLQRVRPGITVDPKPGKMEGEPSSPPAKSPVKDSNGKSEPKQ